MSNVFQNYIKPDSDENIEKIKASVKKLNEIFESAGLSGVEVVEDETEAAQEGSAKGDEEDDDNGC